MKKMMFRALAIAGALLTFATRVHAAAFTENFNADPLSHGWQIFGNTNLFQWDATNHDLAVTWDSSQPNSFFYHSIGTILAVEDAFSVEFDIQLNDVQWTGTFELAVGMFNQIDATNATFSRANGDAPNLFEFDYYPDDGLGEPNVAATMTDNTVNATNTGDFYFIYDTLPMNAGTTYHVKLTHASGDTAISGTVFTNGQVYTTFPSGFSGPIADFRLDSVAVCSYTTTDDTYGDSILAHGTVGNFTVTLPPPPVRGLTGALTNGTWQAQFQSGTNWLYTLQRTVDFQTWNDVSSTTNGTGGNLLLQDTHPPASQSFYRVRANRP